MRDNTDQLLEVHNDTMASIRSLVAALDAARQAEDSEAEDAARTAIIDDALAVLVRPGWHPPLEEPGPAEMYQLVLTAGGPGARIIGGLDEHGDPTDMRLEVADWFQPWTSFDLTEDDERILLTYVGEFYLAG